MAVTGRAVVFQGPGAGFSIEEEPLPAELAPGEAVVEVSLATLCGSDLHTIDGRRTEPWPLVLGHEGVGRVVRAGAGREASLGRRVTWSLCDSCGTCPACADWDLPQKCRSLFKYGHAARATAGLWSGTLSTHVLLRRGTTLVPLPDEVPDRAAVAANCALATVMACLEHAPRKVGRALVQGGGLLGLFACAALRSRGVSEAVCVEPVAERHPLIEACGGAPLLPGAAAGPFDFALEVAGSRAAVAEGLPALRPGGTYVWAGLVHPDSQIDLRVEAVIRGCLTLRGVHNYAHRHLEQAVAFLAAEGRGLPFAQLVSPAHPLDAIETALAAARSGRWPRVAASATPTGR